MGVIARRVIRARRQLGLNKSMFAQAIGLSRRSISKWENGDEFIQVRETTLHKIVEVTKVPISYFTDPTIPEDFPAWNRQTIADPDVLAQFENALLIVRDKIDMIEDLGAMANDDTRAELVGVLRSLSDHITLLIRMRSTK